MSRATRSARLAGAPYLLSAVVLWGAAPVAAQDDAQELAKKLSNPVASLISVPLQLNFDDRIGSEDAGERLTLNLQPVVPIRLNEKWNLISRTILPLVDQKDVFPGAGGQSGIGDVVQSLFFSPAEPTASGLIWGIGPVLLLPTGSDDLLTADQWGAGPTAVVLKQAGPRTFGALVNHIEGFDTKGGRGEISATFFQPFFSRTTPSLWTYTVNLETTYDWERDQWSVPFNFVATKLTSWGSQRVSIGGGLRYWLEGPDGGPEGLGARAILTFLFPK